MTDPQLEMSQASVVDRAEHIGRRLQPWFKAEMRELNGLPGVPGKGLLMGFPMWGKHFIQRWAVYSMASVMAPRNLAALAGRCRLVIYHEEGADAVLFRLTRPINRAGIDIVLREIPDWVIELTKEWESQFFVLGCVQNILAHMAGRSSMAFHMTQPDHVYGPEYFENLFRVGAQHDAVWQAGISIDINQAEADIEQFRAEDGSLVIPDVELGNLGASYLHPQTLAHLMNKANVPDRIPKSHRLLWLGKETIRIHSCHGNPIWLAPHLVRDSPVAFTSTMDTMMPEYIPGAFYNPTPADKMGFLEISDFRKPELGHAVGPDEFAEWVYNQTCFTDEYWPYFNSPTVMPCSFNPDGLEEAEIDRQYQAVLDVLAMRKERMMAEFFQRRFGSRFKRDAALYARAAK